jgi:ParB family chromosome partitioning protein
MLVPIDDIKVKKRVRKEMGDISTLAESMKRYGQISPIVITPDKVLIAGGRRLEAARSLGWEAINAVVADIPDELTLLEYEIEENVQRRNFEPAEAEEAAKRVSGLQNPGFFRRIINAIKRFFRKLFRKRK